MELPATVPSVTAPPLQTEHGEGKPNPRNVAGFLQAEDVIHAAEAAGHTVKVEIPDQSMVLFGAASVWALHVDDDTVFQVWVHASHDAALEAWAVAANPAKNMVSWAVTPTWFAVGNLLVSANPIDGDTVKAILDTVGD